MTLKKDQESKEETQLLEGLDSSREDTMIVPTYSGNDNQNKTKFWTLEPLV